VAVQSCIDDYRKSKIFVLATTNSTRCLPDSLMRSGRLGNAIPVPTPHGATAEAIFMTYLADYKIADDVDIPTICKILEGHSCATIEAAAKSAGALAAYRGLSNIDMDCMTRACLREIRIIPSIHAIPKNGWRDVDLRDSTNKKAIVAIHEAGHALVAELLNSGSVTYICLTEQESHQPFGTTGLAKGHPSSHLRTRREHAIMIGLGGLSAVELVYGTIDFGSKSDWGKAFAAAKDLISCTQVLNPNPHFNKSDTFTDMETTAIHALMEQYRYRVREMLAANRDTLLALAQALLDKGLLLPPEIQRIMASHNPLFEPKQDQTQLATPLLKRAG